MIRRTILAACCALALASVFQGTVVRADQAYGRQWGRTYGAQDWNRFYHYPYVWYPQNFWSRDYFKSSEDLYHRYPAEMRVPVYNRGWHNEFPQARKYHRGHQFILDQF